MKNKNPIQILHEATKSKVVYYPNYKVVKVFIRELLKKSKNWRK